MSDVRWRVTVIATVLVALVMVAAAAWVITHPPSCPPGYVWHVYMIKPLVAKCIPG